ncbi:N-alpha-acetyltransferase 80 like protein [Argiope bruennichi]|uniref:N-alpha-acetyltransferase 80 like protein n=1 Tax=Argiope bruennichi TaxID=94029 RepID=A0A8T0E556_ARGBR|nr:N-alpha-acetyltransferase 80 like protein [Argiope bruennichi]
MKIDNVSVVLLHEYPEYADACANLLNEQWKRSFSARIHSLNRSCKELPDSLVLLEDENGQKRVIGHSRITRVLEDNDGCWIESVVIAEDKRNKGYGKCLMNKTEEYVKKLKFSTAYLSTHDQQGFYERLGYVYSEPVSSISFQKSGLMRNIMFSHMKNKVEIEYQAKGEQNSKRKEQSNLNNLIPPPPPPPPLFNQSQHSLTANNMIKYWMKKSL